MTEADMSHDETLVGSRIQLHRVISDKDFQLEEYTLQLFKMNVMECLHPYLLIASGVDVLIYLFNKDNTYKYLHRVSFSDEINFMTKSDGKVFLVGDSGITYMMIKMSEMAHSDSLYRGDVLSQLGLKLIKLYQNQNESTWSISSHSGLFAVGDNSHIIKIHLPDCTETKPFELVGHKHNVPCLNMYARDRLLSCSIDCTCRIWDLNTRRQLHSRKLDDWVWVGHHLEGRHFKTVGNAPETPEEDIFLVATKKHIYLLNHNLETILFETKFSPGRATRLLPSVMISSLDRISICKVLPKYNLVLLAKQNDNKVILFRMLCVDGKYGLVPLSAIPALSLQNQCVLSVAVDEEYDRIYIACLDKELFVYDLRFLLSDELGPSLEEVLV